MQYPQSEQNLLLRYQMQKDAERRNNIRLAWIITGVIAGIFALVALCVVVSFIVLFGGSIWLLIESFNALPGM